MTFYARDAQPGENWRSSKRNWRFHERSGAAPLFVSGWGREAEAEGREEEGGEGGGLGFYIIDNPFGKRGPRRFAREAETGGRAKAGRRRSKEEGCGSA